MLWVPRSRGTSLLMRTTFPPCLKLSCQTKWCDICIELLQHNCSLCGDSSLGAGHSFIMQMLFQVAQILSERFNRPSRARRMPAAAMMGCRWCPISGNASVRHDATRGSYLGARHWSCWTAGVYDNASAHGVYGSRNSHCVGTVVVTADVMQPGYHPPEQLLLFLFVWLVLHRQQILKGHRLFCQNASV